jgi:hypothetical protein
MYAFLNVKKFVEDNPQLVGNRGEEILARAEVCSSKGLISGGSVDEIMQDTFLSNQFHQIVMANDEHLAIGLTAIAGANGEVVANSEPVNKFVIALELIKSANRLLKEEWDKDADNHLASASYKALNALVQAISENIDGEESDEDYVLSRLLESFSRFADHYDINLHDAFLIGGFPIQKK